jgi:hypothetical protein
MRPTMLTVGVVLMSAVALMTSGGVADGAKKAPAPVPQTGVEVSRLPGDDGSTQWGVAWPIPRFTDQGHGTVLDNLTGLLWLKQVDCLGVRAWADALMAASQLHSGQCGLTDGSVAGDWHLPHVKELLSLIDYGVYVPSISNRAGTGRWSEGDPFTGLNTIFTYTGFYELFWTSTPCCGLNIYPDPWAAWVVDVISGQSNANSPNEGHSTAAAGKIQARPRGGAYPRSQRQEQQGESQTAADDVRVLHSPVHTVHTVQRTQLYALHGAVQQEIDSPVDLRGLLEEVMQPLVTRLSALEAELQALREQSSAPVQRSVYALHSAESTEVPPDARKSERWNIYMPKWLRQAVEAEAAAHRSPSQVLQAVVRRWLAGEEEGRG